MFSIKPFLQQLIDIGVTPALDISERKVTRVLNLLALLGFCNNVFFVFINLYETHYLNALIIFVNGLGCIFFLVANYFHYFLTARLILSLLSIVFMSVSAVLFQNGNEYFLLLNMVASAIIFKQRGIIAALCMMNLLAFVALQYFDTSRFAYDPLPPIRVTINTITALTLMMLALFYYKNQHFFFERELEQSKKELEQKNLELAESNTTKEKIFSILTHDLRSPIAQLHHSLDLLNQELITTEQFKDFTAHIAVQVKQLRSSMDHLLQWSNSQLEGIEAHPQKVVVTSVLEQVHQLLKSALDNKSIQVQLQLDATLVWADPDHLMLVIRNLLSNAIKYSYRGQSIRIHSTLVAHEVIISVADTGKGVDEGTQKILFSSVNLISEKGTMNEKGTGLGLKLCKEFIEKNQGRIWMENNVPSGSIFFVALPSAV